MKLKKEEIKELLIKTIKDHKTLEVELEKFYTLLDASPDSPLTRAVYQIMEDHLDTVTKLIDDKDKYLEWYVYENDYGSKKLTASLGQDMIPVTNIDELIKVMYDGV